MLHHALAALKQSGSVAFSTLISLYRNENEFCIFTVVEKNFKHFNQQVDLLLCNPPRAQIALATLVDGVTGRIVTEPDLGVPYRIRVLGCDAQGLHPGNN